MTSICTPSKPKSGDSHAATGFFFPSLRLNRKHTAREKCSKLYIMHISSLPVAPSSSAMWKKHYIFPSRAGWHQDSNCPVFVAAGESLCKTQPGGRKGKKKNKKACAHTHSSMPRMKSGLFGCVTLRNTDEQAAAAKQEGRGTGRAGVEASEKGGVFSPAGSSQIEPKKTKHTSVSRCKKKKSLQALFLSGLLCHSGSCVI